MKKCRCHQRMITIKKRSADERTADKQVQGFVDTVEAHQRECADDKGKQGRGHFHKGMQLSAALPADTTEQQEASAKTQGSNHIGQYTPARNLR